MLLFFVGRVLSGRVLQQLSSNEDYRKDDNGQATSDHTEYSTQEYVEPEYISADHTIHHPTTNNDHTNKDFDWGYSLHNGPHVWSEYYPECEGYSQSPIVLPTAFDNHPFLKTIEYHNFDEFKAELSQDGKSIVVYVVSSGKDRPYITGGMFKSKSKFYLHKVVIKVGSDCTKGSSHGMDGIFYAGEIECYYFNSKFKSYEEAEKVPGSVAIVSKLIKEEKKDEPVWDTILSKIHMISGTKATVPLNFQFGVDIPKYVETEKGDKECINCDYYFYEGSLSEPPCSEVVLRIVYATTFPIGHKQMEKLRDVLSCETGKPMINNKRYPQPLNFRKVFQHHERDRKHYTFPDMPPPPPHMMQPDMSHMLQPDMAHMMLPDMSHMLQPDMSHMLQPYMSHMLQPDMSNLMRPDGSWYEMMQQLDNEKESENKKEDEKDTDKHQIPYKQNQPHQHQEPHNEHQYYQQPQQQYYQHQPSNQHQTNQHGYQPSNQHQQQTSNQHQTNQHRYQPTQQQHWGGSTKHNRDDRLFMLNPLAPFTGGNLFLGPQDFVDYMPQLEMDLIPEGEK